MATFRLISTTWICSTFSGKEKRKLRNTQMCFVQQTSDKKSLKRSCVVITIITNNTTKAHLCSVKSNKTITKTVLLTCRKTKKPQNPFLWPYTSSISVAPYNPLTFSIPSLAVSFIPVFPQAFLFLSGSLPSHNLRTRPLLLIDF